MTKIQTYRVRLKNGYVFERAIIGVKNARKLASLVGGSIERGTVRVFDASIEVLNEFAGGNANRCIDISQVPKPMKRLTQNGKWERAYFTQSENTYISFCGVTTLPKERKKPAESGAYDQFRKIYRLANSNRPDYVRHPYINMRFKPAKVLYKPFD